MKTRKSKITGPVPYGNEFDITYDLIMDIPIPNGRNSISEKPISSSRTAVTSLSEKKKNSRNSERDSHLIFDNQLLEGSNAPTTRHFGIFGNRSSKISQPPVSMSRLAQMTDSNTSRPVTSHSKHPDFPKGNVQTYVFGFDKPLDFIPRPFISSHRPKTPRSRPSTSMSQKVSGTIPSPRIQLSQNRNLAQSSDALRVHTVLIGGIDQFDEKKKQ